MENFNYLTTINGIYNTLTNAEEFNRFLNLTVFINDSYEMLIKARDYQFDDSVLMKARINECKLKLNYHEYYYILDNIKHNEDIIKTFIFNKYQDLLYDESNFDYID